MLRAKEEKPKKQQAGSGKAAEKQKVAGRTDKRAKAKLKVKQKSATSHPKNLGLGSHV